jgi:2-polyprenyl-3-methyl-5-hydroxy-6-metoxy-1,4-benzoquinol methylase
MAKSDEDYRGHSFRYECDRPSLPRALRERFVELSLGLEGRNYVDEAIGRRAGVARTRLHRSLLSYLSDFDANGLLSMYPMHLLGTEQWKTLVGSTPERRHLDVGAGSGDVTEKLAPLSGETLTTETSWAMSRVLKKRGFACARTDVAESGVPSPRYDLITCLNVIDRCARPRTLLENLTEALAPGGRLVVATPFPFAPIVYEGPNVERPAEILPVESKSWEQAVTELVTEVLEPLGLEVEALSRAPYLSGGDARRELYTLDDAIVVCKRAAP